MIYIKSDKKIATMKEGGNILRAVLEETASLVRPGITTNFLNQEAEKLIESYNAVPAFKGFKEGGNAFPSALCTSVNDEIVHGIPSDRVLEEGDIISIDCGVKYKGLFTDSALTVPVGEINADLQKLLQVTKAALQKGIHVMSPRATLGDIGFAIQNYAEGMGMDVVRELVGHGVGDRVHEPPQVPNFGNKGEGIKLEPGMTLALEPMVTMGSFEIVGADNGWTYSTADGLPAAHFEHTIAVTHYGYELLT